jgi:predicted metallo-beta-lactamase superfamily hydrolase
MKKLFFLLLLAFSMKTSAQSNDYTVSFDGIGAIKLGMKQLEVEKVLNKKILLTNPQDTISGSWQDSAKVKYKNIEVRLSFQRNYTDDKVFDMEVIGIQTTSPVCKTQIS